MRSLRALLAYWHAPVESIRVWRYHLEKIGHTAALALLVSASGVSLRAAALLAWLGYLLLGKALWLAWERPHRGLPWAGWSAELVDTVGDGWIGMAVPLLVWVHHCPQPIALGVTAVLWLATYLMLCDGGALSP